MDDFRLEPCPPICDVCGKTGSHEECAAFTQSIEEERNDLNQLALWEVPDNLPG